MRGISDAKAFVVRMCIVLIDDLRMPFSERNEPFALSGRKGRLNSNYYIGTHNYLNSKCSLLLLAR